MPKDSQGQAFPATFPLNLDRRKKKKRADGSDDDDDDEIETPAEQMFNILQDIQMKLVNLTTTVNEVSTKLDNHVANCDNSEHVKELKDQILSTQQALLNIDSDKNQYEEDKRRKFQCIPKWGELHKKRRDAYYKYFSVNSIANIMEQYASSDTPYIMRAYRPKYSPGEKEERYKLREKHAISTMMMDVSQKHITASEQLDIFTKVDEEISTLCDNLGNAEDTAYLKELWAKEVSAAEEKSQTFFNQKKKPWWLNLPTNYPYNGQQTAEQDPEPNDARVERANTTSPNSNRETTANSDIPEEDVSMDISEPENNPNTNPWVEVTYNNRGRNPTRKVHPNNHAQNTTTSQNQANRKHNERNLSRNQGGHSGQRGNRGGYRGTSRGRNHSYTRGTSRGRNRSYTRGRSRGQGNYNYRRPNTSEQSVFQ